MNYESELNDILFHSLCELYGIKDETILYRYFYLRCLVYNLNKGELDKLNKDRLLVDFLIKELNLPEENGGLIYRGQKIHKGVNVENSLTNIINEWEFRASLFKIQGVNGAEQNNDECITLDWKKTLRHANNKAKAFKKKTYYEYYLKYNALVYLNKRYNVLVGQHFKIEGFEYREEHNFFIRTMEEEYYAYIHSVEINTQDVNTISENDLEKYITKNISKIENGLKVVSTQYVVNNGRIDILAVDENNEYVVIELKTQIDRELLWQVIYYPMEIKDLLKTNNVRVITLCPEYPDFILKPLKTLNYVEILKYSLSIQLGKINEIKISRL